jgi:preprotein translocase subunit YajC
LARHPHISGQEAFVPIVQLVTLMLAFTLFPAVAAAQRMATFDDISLVVEPGQRVAVKDIGGATTRGSILEVTPAAITLRIGGSRTRTFDRATVSEVRRSDRLWNGLLIGAAAGFIGTEIWSYSLCGPRGYDDECAAIVTGVGWLTFVPGGMAVGALVDKAIGTQLIYAQRPRGTSIYVAPAVSPSRLGLTARVSF